MAYSLRLGITGLAALALTITDAVANAPPPAQVCRELSVQSPPLASTQHDPRPTLRWQAQSPGPYRVQVAVGVPESRVLAMHDVQVTDTQWTLPDAIAVDRAAVKVMISQACPQLDAQDLQARTASFFIDLREACTLDAVRWHAESARVSWTARSTAMTYRVRLMRPSEQPTQSLRLIHEALLVVPTWVLPPMQRPGDVVTVQPVCGAYSGRPVAVPLM